MLESIQLFKSICNNRFFRQAGMILFLNKKDLFAEKLRFSSIKVCFPEYTGSWQWTHTDWSHNYLMILTLCLGLNTYEPSLQYIQEQFEQVDQREKINGHQRELYTHVTCATDTEAMQFVFDAISDMIIQNNLIHAGIFWMVLCMNEKNMVFIWDEVWEIPRWFICVHLLRSQSMMFKCRCKCILVFFQKNVWKRESKQFLWATLNVNRL